jgi:2-polyprenyl-6-methoxyphenol hydroxylase-like FAD-dependent oxidoreductase
MTGPPARTVLVVGAGPTGLTLAAQVHAHGGRVRIIERRLERRPSRAFIVHPRTLEVLAPLGVVAELIARGDPSASATVRAAGRTARVTLARPGIKDTAYPFLLAIPQAAVEEVLEEHLRQVGVTVERGVELVSASQGRDAVQCVLRGPDGHRYQAEAGYLVGCDGANSTVRRTAGIRFPGRDYRPTLLIADLDAEGDLAPGAVNGYVGAGGILFLFPSPDAAGWRLLTVSPTPGPADPLDLATLQAAADRFTGGGLRLRDLVWATTVRLRRGQATRYRAGRILLAGDAAHVHSPAGAQGMNTGIQDACNLGWKLALVATDRAGPQLLSSYHAERWPVARRVRQLTDLAFLIEAGDLPLLGWLRGHLAPLALPLLNGHPIPAWAFRILGGLRIRYRGSPAVEQGRPAPWRAIRAGDRLVDGLVVRDGEGVWLHQVLRAPGFHLLLCGRAGDFDRVAAESLPSRCAAPLSVHWLAREPGPGGLADPPGEVLGRLGGGTAVYLIRPDGYVGYQSRGASLDGVARHLQAGTVRRGDPESDRSRRRRRRLRPVRPSGTPGVGATVSGPARASSAGGL